ncbi:hypothetical protein [Gordonia malaquae]|uniref:hypothetical protein n=1 Tax=Gordonia malaquae TaxID=410332 RepID=UPI0030FE7B3D
MNRKSALAAVVAVAGVTASVVGVGEADAAKHGIKLTHSQTVVVSQQGLGTAFSSVPYIPNLVYNPTWGRIIQHDANIAGRQGGCISVGIITVAGKSNVNYVTRYPARSCAR